MYVCMYVCMYVSIETLNTNVKIGVINTLTIRAKRIFDSAHLDRELEHLVKVFKDNGYNENLIRKTMKRSQAVR